MSHMFGFTSPTTQPPTMSAPLLLALFEATSCSQNPQMSCLQVSFTDCHLDQELHDSIEDQHQDVYIQRQQAEMNSGIFNFPLPPLRRTLVEIVNEWVEESLAPDLLLLAMVILSLLIQFCIILMMKLILYQSEESPAVAIYESFRPVMRVVTIAKLILRLMAMIIQLNVQWLRRSAVPGQDRTQQL